MIGLYDITSLKIYPNRPNVGFIVIKGSVPHSSARWPVCGERMPKQRRRCWVSPKCFESLGKSTDLALKSWINETSLERPLYTGWHPL